MLLSRRQKHRTNHVPFSLMFVRAAEWLRKPLSHCKQVNESSKLELYKLANQSFLNYRFVSATSLWASCNLCRVKLFTINDWMQNYKNVYVYRQETHTHTRTNTYYKHFLYFFFYVTLYPYVTAYTYDSHQ